MNQLMRRFKKCLTPPFSRFISLIRTTPFVPFLIGCPEVMGGERPVPPHPPSVPLHTGELNFRFCDAPPPTAQKDHFITPSFFSSPFVLFICCSSFGNFPTDHCWSLFFLKLAIGFLFLPFRPGTFRTRCRPLLFRTTAT